MLSIKTSRAVVNCVKIEVGTNVELVLLYENTDVTFGTSTVEIENSEGAIVGMFVGVGVGLKLGA